MRTVTVRADRMTAETLMLVNGRLAQVVEVKFAVELGALGQEGPVRAPVPYYWVEVGFVWMDATNGPVSSLCIEGNRWMETRERAR